MIADLFNAATLALAAGRAVIIECVIRVFP